MIRIKRAVIAKFISTIKNVLLLCSQLDPTLLFGDFYYFLNFSFPDFVITSTSFWLSIKKLCKLMLWVGQTAYIKDDRSKINLIILSSLYQQPYTEVGLQIM